MVSIKWCIKKKNGLELIEPNKNMSDSYLRMAEESIEVLQIVNKSNIWTATSSYYIFYYSLYALMLRIGVKCEIHACSLEFMKLMLNEFYSNVDSSMIHKAFSARIDLQYYADRPVEMSIITETKTYSKLFFIKTKDILARITEEQIKGIRSKVKNLNK